MSHGIPKQVYTNVTHKLVRTPQEIDAELLSGAKIESLSLWIE